MNHIYTIRNHDFVLSKIKTVSTISKEAGTMPMPSGGYIKTEPRFALVIDGQTIEFGEDRASRDTAHSNLLKAIDDYYEDAFDILTHIRTKEW